MKGNSGFSSGKDQSTYNRSNIAKLKSDMCLVTRDRQFCSGCGWIVLGEIEFVLFGPLIVPIHKKKAYLPQISFCPQHLG